MNNMHEIVERHIRESALQLRRIDEVMLQSRHTPAAASVEVQAMLGEIRQARDKLVQELDQLHRASANQSATATRTAEDAKSIFASVGLQFEKALAAVFEPNKPSKP